MIHVYLKFVCFCSVARTVLQYDSARIITRIPCPISQLLELRNSCALKALHSTGNCADRLFEVGINRHSRFYRMQSTFRLRTRIRNRCDPLTVVRQNCGKIRLNN